MTFSGSTGCIATFRGMLESQRAEDIRVARERLNRLVDVLKNLE